jgi:hypothetical protein
MPSKNKICIAWLLTAVSMTVTCWSCGKAAYGTYNTAQAKDQSAFYQIKLNSDNTVEKTEIHTISDFAKGRFIVISDKHVICFLDSSRNGFPPDTLRFLAKGKRLYFMSEEKKKVHLVRQ